MYKIISAASILTLCAAQPGWANQNCESPYLNSPSELMAMDNQKRAVEIQKLVDCAMRSNMEAQSILNNIGSLRFDKILSDVIAERDALQKISDDRKIAIGQLETDIIDLRSKHDEATKKLTALANELSVSKTTIGQYEAERQNLDKVISDQSLQILKLTQTIADISTERQKLEDKIKSLQTQSSADASEMAKLKSELDRLTQSLNAQIGINEEQGRSTAQLKSDLDSEIKKKEALEILKSELKTSLSEALVSLEKSSQDIKALTDEKAGLMQEVEKLKGEKERLNIIHKDLDEKYKALIVEHDKMAGSLSEANTRIAELITQRSDLVDKNTKYDKEITDLKTKRDALMAELDALKSELGAATGDVKRLTVEKQELEDRIAVMDGERKNLDAKIIELDAKTAALNRDLTDLTTENSALKSDVDRLTAKNKALEDQIDALSKVRSEFFAKLKEKLKDQKNILIVGDRFIIQSEVLFDVGSPDLNKEGKAEIKEVANLLKELSPSFPAGVNWVLQVNGHTDVQKIIPGGKFASNWELSTARALTVVKLIQSEGVEPNRLAAAGFGEYQPVDKGSSQESYAKNRRIELKLTDDGPY